MTSAMNRIMTTPLAVSVQGRSICVVVAADEYVVAPISSFMNDREEYARLFAAAPELLAALMKLADTIEWIGGEYSNELAEEVGIARAAIAKANGDAS